MAYEKQTWETGQVITAEKLNHMEDGIGSQPFIVLVGAYMYDPDEGLVDYHMITPLADLKQAITDGKVILLNLVDENSENQVYTYNGKSTWEGISYYTFMHPLVSKFEQFPIQAYINYIKISMNGDVQLDSFFLGEEHKQ